MSIKTQGTQLYFHDPDSSSSDVVDVGCVQSVSGLGAPIEEIETTCLNDTARTFTPGLQSPGTGSVEINYDPTTDAHDELHAHYKAGSTLKWAMGLSDGTTVPDIDSTNNWNFDQTRTFIYFDAFVQDYPFDVQLNNVIKSTLALRVSGEINIDRKT